MNYFISNLFYLIFIVNLFSNMCIHVESSYGMLGTGDPFLTEGHALFSNTQTWSDVQLANNQETLKCDKQVTWPFYVNVKIC